MIFPNLFNIMPESFGLDLSDRSIKLAKLSKKGEKLRFENFIEKSVPAGAMENGLIKSPDKIAKALRDAVDKSGIKTPYASSSLPEQHTYIRVVQLPLMSPKELKDAVRWEAASSIPLSLDESYFDWEIIRQERSAGEALKHAKEKSRHLDVLISAAPREVVESYVDVIQKAGLKPFSMEPESLASARSIVKDSFSKDAVMIIDLGLTQTIFSIYAGYSLRFVASSDLSGAEMTSAVEKSLGIGTKQAEIIKRREGFSPKGKTGKILEPLLLSLIKQAEGYLDYYENHRSHFHGAGGVKRILLIGGGAHLPDSRELISEALKLNVEVGDPLVNLNKEKDWQIKTPKEPLIYSTAVGLAIGT